MNKKNIFLVIIYLFLTINNYANNIPSHNNYIIDLEFDTTTSCFNGKMIMEWENNSNNTIKKLPFHFEFDNTNYKSLKVNLENDEISIKYIKTKFEGFVISLKEAIKPREKFQIIIEFKSINKVELFNEKQLHYTDAWIPQLHYFEDGLFFPNYQQASNYLLRIKYSDEYTLTSSGASQGKTIKNETIIEKYIAESVPSIGIVMSKTLKEKQLKAKNGVIIRSFYYDNDSIWGEKLLHYAKNVIDYYADTIGFYPHKVLSIIPGFDKPYGGWPLSPNIVMIHRGIDQKGDYAETHGHWITAHEIAHQYWGFNYILEPKNIPEWFGISMGIYTDFLYSQEVQLNRNYQDFAQRYINGYEKGFNTRITQTKDTLNKQYFDWNNVIRHGKAYAVLCMLRYEIGEEIFSNIFFELLNQYKGVNITLEVFQKLCEDHSNRNLGWFFDQWYNSNKFLEFEVMGIKVLPNSNQIKLSFNLINTGDAVLSKIQVAFITEDNEKIIKEYNIEKRNSLIEFESNKIIKQILIDPNYHYPIINRRSTQNIIVGKM